MFSINGEGILIKNDTTKGILVRGYKQRDISKIKVINEGILEGSLYNFNTKTISIGRSLAIDLNINVFCSQLVNVLKTQNKKDAFVTIRKMLADNKITDFADLF